ncbi:LOW QUALITY PROTEIN: prestin-like, partial [Galendromus occidentalis]|uniref:LOW QUALITY PROTEIN: prestin-like n=1 Tax=Galendromus occidentalis TaxID=34638 RepID=A0AAJ6QST2_9ACAR
HDLKGDLIADLLAGITLAIFHVPQAFGYALIVGVPAVNGLYTAMFPMMMYILMGTSRQNSIGAFAVVCIMTSQVVFKARTALDLPDDMIVNVTAATSLLSGVYLLLFGLLKLGGLSVFLSDQFISGFTAGVSVHIGTSQLSGLFGFEVEHYSGAFSLVKTYVNFFTRVLHETHWPTLVFAVIAVVIILAVKIMVDPYLLRKIRMPFPIEMLMVILSIVVSKQFDLKGNNFKVIENIPHNLPVPTVPVISSALFQAVVIDALAIAVVSVTIDISLGRIWARERGYQISANQELFAVGACNVFGAFFGCFPVGASVPRSSLQFLAGGRTQLVSFFNVVLIAITIVALGPLFEKIPTVILSSIIVVSLKKIFMQVRDFTNFWAISKIDGHVWLVTFFATVILNVQLGLICGVIFSLLTLVFKIQMPKTYLLGMIPDTDFYVPIKLYVQAIEIPGVKIFHFGGPLHFGNAEFFRTELGRRTNIGGHQYANPIAEDMKHNDSADVVWRPAQQVKAKTIILDFSRITFVDGTSAQVLKEVVESYHKLGLTICVAGCSSAVYSLLRKAGVSEIVLEPLFFPTIHDAVMSVTRNPTTVVHIHAVE